MSGDIKSVNYIEEKGAIDEKIKSNEEYTKNYDTQYPSSGLTPCGIRFAADTATTKRSKILTEPGGI
ncbi:MAG: hypothetical protein LBE71_02200 [Dysgonamonadaceae bacterium]|nr:hypothetical protein [Dysgonamonadaceae bacterium]